MKSAYIIFSNTKPYGSKAVLNLIVHFCREHALNYHLYTDPDNSLINIEGMDYFIKLQEKAEEAQPTYWMICCLQKGQSILCQNIA